MTTIETFDYIEKPINTNVAFIGPDGKYYYDSETLEAGQGNFIYDTMYLKVLY